MKRRRLTAVALTVAGSDSGGGAGIQADLKTFHVHGVFGTCALTAITAQNPGRISAVQPLKPRLVAEQMDRVFEAFPIRAGKTGMLYDAAIIESVADRFAHRKVVKLVVDPVMVASSGAVLLRKDAVKALTRGLFPLAVVVTPNVAEAEVLTQRAIRTLDDLRLAARRLAEKYGVPFLVKGGHLRGANRAVDVLFDGTDFHEYRPMMAPKIRTHGTGCTFSAAITANLALGYGLSASIGRAKGFVTTAIQSAPRVGRYRVLRI